MTDDFATRQVHGGAHPDAGFGAAVTPIHFTAGFAFDDFDDGRERFAPDGRGFFYSRYGNPTVAALERRVAALEGAAETIAVASGQAAVSLTLVGLLRAGDHVVAASTIFEGTRGFLTDFLARFGITSTLVDTPERLDSWRAAIRPETRLLFGDPIANPSTRVLDVRALADLAHEGDRLLVVDNTLASPYLLRPIEHGADVVIHSASKYLSGHGAALGGVVSLAPGLAADVAAALRADASPRLGATLSPFNAFQILQGIETLSFRVERATSTALRLAEWLSTHPAVESVDHAGLPAHPSYDLARRTLPRGVGGVFSFTVRGGADAARRVVDAVRTITRMTHLGDARTLLLHPASTSHVHRTPAEQAAAGIRPGTLRLAVGLESADDLRADLARALDAAIAEPAATPASGRSARVSPDRVPDLSTSGAGIPGFSGETTAVAPAPADRVVVR